MKIQGEYTFGAPRQPVWDLLHNPDALSRALPGVERFEQVGPNEYRATVRAGVAAVRGTYQGRIKLTDLQPPERYTLDAGGQGSTGTFEATAQIALTEQDGRTVLRYDVDAQVGGAVAGVGQRMLGGVAKLMAGQFFKAMEAQLRGQPEARPAGPAVAGGPASAPSAATAGPGLPDLLGLAGPIGPMAAIGAAGLTLGFLLGRGRRASDARSALGDYELAAAIRDLASAIREQRRR
jgi:carbon monoxide dehydrogenase subunit G